MSDRAQLAALGAAFARPTPASRPNPVRINGLEALGRSSHGGAPITGSVSTDIVEQERAFLAQHPAPSETTKCSA